MKRKQTEKELPAYADEIIRTEEYRRMKQYRHHIKGSVYDHSLKVAYLCDRHHRRFKMKTTRRELLRGALLHDYYLYDWHDIRGARRYLHGFVHAGRALENALARYPDLTPIEQDMILRHMFPLIPIPPKTAAGWLLCFYDKVATLSDYFGENKWKKRADDMQR